MTMAKFAFPIILFRVQTVTVETTKEQIEFAHYENIVGFEIIVLRVGAV